MTFAASAEQFSWAGYGVDKLDLSLAPRTLELPRASATPAENKSTAPPTNTGQTALAPQGTVRAISEELLDDQYQLAFTANQLRIGQNRFSSIQIDGSGSINQHQVEALVKSTRYGRADLKLAGNFDGSEWQGKLQQLAVKLKKVPRWWLTSSKPIRIGADAIQLGDQCLTTRSNLTAQVERADHVEREQVISEWRPNQSPVNDTYAWLDNRPAPPANRVEKYSLPQLCIQGEWARTTGAKAGLRMDSVPLRQFLALFKTEVYFAGVMDGSLNLTSSDFSLAGTEANASISTRNAELRYQYAGGTTEVYAWRNFGVRANVKQAQLNADAGMEWVGYGTINATSHLDLAQKKINSGNLQAEFSNLAPLETLLPFANDMKGDFRADLTAGGTFTQPYVLGNISLHNGSANLPRLGLDLNNVELDINSTQAGNISLMSQMQSGDGKLSLVGDITKLGTPDWNLQGFVNGTDFKVINLQQLKANLSPDIKLTANREAVRLSGDTVIPWLRANIKRLPDSATQVSSDAVIVNDTFGKDEPEPPVKVFTNLTLTLGDDVRFKGFGLNSKLTGKLSLLKESQRQFFTSGYVSVVDGSYKAYGQTLTIDRGRLVFQGPYENPGLDIRASRIIKDDDETQVGLEISGTLQRPVAHVFSVPTKSESQAMMMLVTGKPATEVTKADASVLLGAMSGLGGDSDGSVSTEITRIFRLDELEIKSDEGIEQSQLWMGKYLTPKLLVRYAVGIFDSAFSLGMEYHLTNHLRLEAESGETQSVDIVYKIER
jgi:translocation and assembly module TamB